MTPSEAFAAWLDGKRVQIMRKLGWHDVIRFRLELYGLCVDSTDGAGESHSVATDFGYRLKDATPQLAPVSPHNDTAVAYRAGQADSEAWGLLRALLVAHESGTDYDIRCACLQARDALKKAGKL